MLHGLMRGPVLAEADRIVGPHVDHVQPGERRQPDRSAHVVAERQEGRVVRDEPVVVRDPVGDPAHAVFPDPETQVATGLFGAEVRIALDIGQVRLRQVRRTAEQLRHRPCERLDRLL
jgi:hypothetical protein